MPNKRHTLVVRLCQVKGNCTQPDLANPLDPSTHPNLIAPIACRH